MTDIKRTSAAYMVQSWGLMLLTTGAMWLFMQLSGKPQMLVPVVVGLVFGLVVETAVALLWSLVAQRSPDSLPQFYTSVSALRMLLVLATMATYYFAVKADTRTFIVVFGCYYVVMLCHHSIFFARVANRQ